MILHILNILLYLLQLKIMGNIHLNMKIDNYYPKIYSLGNIEGNLLKIQCIVCKLSYKVSNLAIHFINNRKQGNLSSINYSTSIHQHNLDISKIHQHISHKDKYMPHICHLSNQQKTHLYIHQHKYYYIKTYPEHKIHNNLDYSYKLDINQNKGYILKLLNFDNNLLNKYKRRYYFLGSLLGNLNIVNLLSINYMVIYIVNIFELQKKHNIDMGIVLNKCQFLLINKILMCMIDNIYH